jgi:site-specific DNA-methyltransferase (adenine-specific)
VSTCSTRLVPRSYSNQGWLVRFQTTVATRRAVVCGDATELHTYDRLRNDVNDLSANGLKPGLGESRGPFVDIICTDPPYCLLKRRRKGGDLRDPKANSRSKTDNHVAVPRYDSVRDYQRFTKRWLEAALSVTKPAAIVIIWTNSLGRQPIAKVAEEMGCRYIGEYIWAKRSSVRQAENSTKNETLLRVYESALVFRRIPQESKNSNIDLVSQCNLAEFGVVSVSHMKKIPWSCISGYSDDLRSDGTKSDVSAVANDVDGTLHPCQKPFSVLQPLLLTWLRPDEILLDCFAGSGAILDAAEVLGAKFVAGIEVLPEWANKNKLLSTKR